MKMTIMSPYLFVSDHQLHWKLLLLLSCFKTCMRNSYTYIHTYTHTHATVCEMRICMCLYIFPCLYVHKVTGRTKTVLATAMTVTTARFKLFRSMRVSAIPLSLVMSMYSPNPGLNSFKLWQFRMPCALGRACHVIRVTDTVISLL